MKYQVMIACHGRAEPLLYPLYISKVILAGSIKGLNQEKVSQNVQELEMNEGKPGSPPALFKARNIQNLLADRVYKKELKSELGPDHHAFKTFLQQKNVLQAFGQRILAAAEPVKEKEGTLTHPESRQQP